MPRDSANRPQTTLARALLALGLCIVLFAFGMALGTAPGWPESLASEPNGALETVAAFFFMFAVWAYYIGIVFVVFAGIPWAVLHLVGFRSWWIATIAGFAVAFCIALLITMQMSEPSQETSQWISDQSTIIEVRLASYGPDTYGPGDAIRNGIWFGSIGAIVGLALWRIAYRRSPTTVTDPHS